MAGVAGKSGRKAIEQPLRHALGEILDDIDPKTGRKKMYQVARNLVEQALDGDLAAIREVWDRMEGKPKQANVIEGSEDNPLVTEVRYRVYDPKEHE